MSYPLRESKLVEPVWCTCKDFSAIDEMILNSDLKLFINIAVRDICTEILSARLINKILCHILTNHLVVVSFPSCISLGEGVDEMN